MAPALPRSLPPPRRAFQPPRTAAQYLAWVYQQLVPTPCRRLPAATGTPPTAAARPRVAYL